MDALLHRDREPAGICVASWIWLISESCPVDCSPNNLWRALPCDCLPGDFSSNSESCWSPRARSIWTAHGLTRTRRCRGANRESPIKQTAMASPDAVAALERSMTHLGTLTLVRECASRESNTVQCVAALLTCLLVRC